MRCSLAFIIVSCKRPVRLFTVSNAVVEDFANGRVGPSRGSISFRKTFVCHSFADASFDFAPSHDSRPVLSLVRIHLKR